MMHVFVYGTLKKGQPNNYRLFDSANGKAEFLGSALTVEQYPLVIASNHNIPFLLNIPGHGQRVHGEVYKVDKNMLTFLDDFEDVPDMYQRTQIKLEVKAWEAQTRGHQEQKVGDVTKAFVYSTATYKPDWPTLPNYDSYDSYGDHRLEYVMREARDT